MFSRQKVDFIRRQAETRARVRRDLATVGRETRGRLQTCLNCPQRVHFLRYLEAIFIKREKFPCFKKRYFCENKLAYRKSKMLVTM